MSISCHSDITPNPQHKTPAPRAPSTPGVAPADTVIRLSGVSKVYNLYCNKQDRLKEALHPKRRKYHKEFFALRKIDLEVKRGEILGIIGKNGSGKSTLLQVISKVLTPTSGTVATTGNIVALLELGAGFNPEFTGMENIYFYCSILGFRKQEIDNLIDAILEFAGLEDFIHQPLKTYSSGMRARLAFAVSVNVEPDILILDEVLAVGDELFRRKCYSKMEQFFKGGKTILLVTHSAATIDQLCTRAVFLDKGEILLEGPTKLVTRNYSKYLQAKKENEEIIKSEIIALNKDEKLKQAIYGRMAQDADEKRAGDFLDDFESDRNNRADDTQYIHEELEKILTNKPYFIPDFQPITKEIIKNADIDIFDVKITTIDGKQVNCLVRGETYYYEFMVKSNIDAENINISSSIATEKNVLISNIGFRGEKSLIPKIYQSDEYKVKVKFKCYINKGTYYINIMLLSHTNCELEVLSKVVDALVFRVLPQEDRTIVGLVTLEQEIFIDKISE